MRKIISQLNLFGQDKVQVAIDRIKMFEPKEGYYLAFSGGKDSLVIKTLADMAGVKYDSHYNNTTVDPPELIYYIKKYHPDVIIERPPTTMWKLIVKQGIPPTRLARYCCSILKEGGGTGRFVITGVRWAESAKRKNNRSLIEFDRYGSDSKKAKESREIFLNSDNDTKRNMLENCTIKGKHVLNPIVDWSDTDVWNFIKSNNLPYCKLYEQGYKRLGCIGCPNNTNRVEEFKRYPKQYQAYLRAFDRMLKVRTEKGLKTQWKTAQEVMDWWLKE